MYPLFNITQHVIYNPVIRTCSAWDADVDSKVAEVYYRLVKRVNPPDVIALTFSGKSRLLKKMPLHAKISPVVSESDRIRSGLLKAAPKSYSWQDWPGNGIY